MLGRAWPTQRSLAHKSPGHLGKAVTRPSHMWQDVLQEFSGKWELRPVMDEANKTAVGTQAVLNQEILPKGKGPPAPPL